MAVSGLCPCGGGLADLEHSVKTLKGALEWDSTIKESDLPIRVMRKVCRVCGRQDLLIMKSCSEPDDESRQSESPAIDFIALDLETANSDHSSICQIGIAAFHDGQVVDEQSFLVDPQEHFDPINVSIHGITEEIVAGSPTFAEISAQLNELLSDTICATHTAFDRNAIRRCCAKYNIDPPSCNWLDTAQVARRAWGDVAQRGYGLSNLAEKLGIQFQHHDALEDAKAAGLVFCAAMSETDTSAQDWLEKVHRRVGGRSYRESIVHDCNPVGHLSNEVVVLSGKFSIPKKQLAQIAADSGCTVMAGVSKKVTILVVDGRDEITSKHAKVLTLNTFHKCNIQVLTESDFAALLETT